MKKLLLPSFSILFSCNVNTTNIKDALKYRYAGVKNSPPVRVYDTMYFSPTDSAVFRCHSWYQIVPEEGMKYNYDGEVNVTGDNILLVRLNEKNKTLTNIEDTNMVYGISENGKYIYANGIQYTRIKE